MKKVGILTFTYGDNYGQRLQNLAVQTILERLGFDAFTIPQVKPRNYKIANGLRHQNFEKFDDSFVKYYGDTIGKYKIPRGLSTFDYFIVGSDQVWSPYSSDVNWSFFLKFAPSEKRISYAPSVASDDIPKKKEALYRWYLHGFKEISVRESKTEKILRKYTNVPIQTLIDPTLMFDSQFWNNYSLKPKFDLPKNYILYYSLGQKGENEEVIRFTKAMNMSLVSLQSGSDYFTSGPSEFLYLISNAAGVITDSYHGTIFSILYHKPVYFVPRNSNEINMQSRFDTLFDKLGVTLECCNQFPKRCIIDNEKTDVLLDGERKKTDEYLKRVLHINHAESK